MLLLLLLLLLLGMMMRIGSAMCGAAAADALLVCYAGGTIDMEGITYVPFTF